MNIQILESFKNELEKIAVSPEWLERLSSSGAAKNPAKAKKLMNKRMGVYMMEALKQPPGGPQTPRFEKLRAIQRGLSKTVKPSIEAIGGAAKKIDEATPKKLNMSKVRNAAIGLTALGGLYAGKKLYDKHKENKEKQAGKAKDFMNSILEKPVGQKIKDKAVDFYFNRGPTGRAAILGAVPGAVMGGISGAFDNRGYPTIGKRAKRALHRGAKGGVTGASLGALSQFGHDELGLNTPHVKPY